MNAIEIRNLSKSFRGMYAVDHLNMTVPQGAIYSFIGENGSGKSTTEKNDLRTDPRKRRLDQAVINVALCAAGGSLFAFGLGAISKVVLKKTSLV